jgi:hypothetical protein
MYSVAKLAEMYETTRQTVNEKFKLEELKPYIIEDKKGKKLITEGLNVFNLIMADSKVKPLHQVDSQVDSPVTPENIDYLTCYIDTLKTHINLLQKEKEYLIERHEREKNEMRNFYENIFKLFSDQQKRIEPPKRSIFSFFTRRKDDV